MSSYDAVEGFVDYSSKQQWKNYIQDFIVPLWQNSLLIKEFYEDLKNEFNEVLLRAVDKEYLPLLLGGMASGREDIYKKDSLAKLYNRFFGMRVADIQSWMLGGASGIDVKVRVDETSLVKFVTELSRWLERALTHQALVSYKEPNIDYERLKKDHQKLVETVGELYQQALAFTVNYNYGTFFINSIKQIPQKMMIQAYPKIDGVRDFLQSEFGLSKMKWKPPFNENTNFYTDYSFWCWPENNSQTDKGGWCLPDYNEEKSFGGSICVANDVVWNHIKKGTSITDLGSILSSYFSTVTNLKEDYFVKVKDRITGKLHSSIYYRGITASEERARVGETSKTLMAMIDEVAPYLFLGLVKISYLGEDYIQVIPA